MTPPVAHDTFPWDEDELACNSFQVAPTHPEQERASAEAEEFFPKDREVLEQYFGDLDAFRAGHWKRKMTRQMAYKYHMRIAEEIPDDEEDIIQRYRRTPLHAIFLYTLEDAAVGDYIRDNWASLDRLASESCMIHIIQEQYRNTTDAYTLIEQVDVIRESGFCALHALPGLFFWDRQQHHAFVRFGPDPDHAMIKHVLRELFTHIRQDPTINAIKAWQETQGQSQLLSPEDVPPDIPSRPGSSVVAQQADQRRQIDLGVIIPLREEFQEFWQHIPVEGRAVVAPKGNQRQRFYQFDYRSSATGYTYSFLVGFAEQMGPIDMAFFTQNMLTLCCPQTLVMLGTAGSIDVDARLGDVVLATQVESYLDRGKGQEGLYPGTTEFLFNGHSYNCSSDLALSIQHFQFTDAQRHQAWVQQGANYLQQTLDEATRCRLLASQALRPAPMLQSGPLASGPLVVASSGLKKDLHKHRRDLIAVEMEAAGMMHALSKMDRPVKALILRGISDFSDEHKNQLEKTTDRLFRAYAMHNVSQLFWQLLDAGIFPTRQGD